MEPESQSTVPLATVPEGALPVGYGNEVHLKMQKNNSLEMHRSLPEDQRRFFEVIGGKFVARERMSGGPHSRVAGEFYRFLSDAFLLSVDDLLRGELALWVVCSEQDVLLPNVDNTVIPDIQAWRRGRYPEEEDDGAIKGIPDFVCEVSATTFSTDAGGKKDMYREAGVEVVWVVDAHKQEIHVWDFSPEAAPGGTYQVLVPSASPVVIPPFKGLEVNVRDLFLRATLGRRPSGRVFRGDD